MHFILHRACNLSSDHLGIYPRVFLVLTDGLLLFAVYGHEDSRTDSQGETDEQWNSVHIQTNCPDHCEISANVSIPLENLDNWDTSVHVPSGEWLR